MTGDALIVFTKNPVAGKVKTRLADTIGDDRALRIHEYLQGKTMLAIEKLDCKIFIFYSDFIPDIDQWTIVASKKLQQMGNHLGERMLDAFCKIFAEGFSRVVIIGTDCFEISSGYIDQAFRMLYTYDVVIGPAVDGGYYLLGLRYNIPSIFQEIVWSTDAVLAQTLRKAEAVNATYVQLPILRDIDEVEDIQCYDELMAIAFPASSNQ